MSRIAIFLPFSVWALPSLPWQEPHLEPNKRSIFLVAFHLLLHAVLLLLETVVDGLGEVGVAGLLKFFRTHVAHRHLLALLRLGLAVLAVAGTALGTKQTLNLPCSLPSPASRRPSPS